MELVGLEWWFGERGTRSCDGVRAAGRRRSGTSGVVRVVVWTS